MTEKLFYRTDFSAASVTRKLVSPRGTLLGTITYPEWGERQLQQRGVWQFPFMIETPVRWYDPSQDPGIGGMVYYCCLEKAQGGVMLSGCSLEQFETIHGCSFAPGAAYLRSLLKDGA